MLFLGSYVVSNDNMKIGIFSTSGEGGGAAKSTFTLFISLKSDPAHDVRLYLARPLRTGRSFPDISVLSISKPIARFESRLKGALDRLVLRLSWRQSNYAKSTMLLPSCIDLRAATSDREIVHLHWIYSGFVSLWQILRLRVPIVWTLHDSWPFCGTEHHPLGRWSDSYMQNYSDRPLISFSYGLNLDRIIILVKAFIYNRKPIAFIAPSQWIYSKFLSSPLSKHCEIVHIPNPIDTSIYRPLAISETTSYSRNRRWRVGLIDAFLSSSFYKGIDLGFEVILQLLEKSEDIDLVYVGNQCMKSCIPTKYLERVTQKSFLDGDANMVEYLNEIDLLIIPSRIENLSQLACQSIACGTPVAMFAIGGNPEIVQNERFGVLANPFSTSEMSGKIITYMKNYATCPLRTSLHDFAESQWGAVNIINKHIRFYERVLGQVNS